MSSEAKAPSVASVWIAAATALMLAFAFLVLASGPAFAAMSRPLLRSISTGAGGNPQALATDAAGDFYVFNLGGSRPGIAKFDSTGKPVPFSAGAGYVKGNVLTGTPEGAYSLYGGFPYGVAVDSSGGPNDGDIYVTNLFLGSVFVYDGTGSYKGRLDGNEPHYLCGVAVNQANGAVYTGDIYGTGNVHRFAAPVGDPADDVANGVLSGLGSTCPLAADSTGAAYVANNGVTKFAASQFEAATPSGTTVSAQGAFGLAADPLSDSVYIDGGDHVTQRTGAGVQVGAAFPVSPLSESRGIVADGSGDVAVTESIGGDGGISIFGAAEANLPLASTGASSNVVQNSADVAGEVDPDSAGGVTRCEFVYGPDAGYAEGSAPCSPTASNGSPITGPTPVTAALTGLRPGVHYHYRLVVANANGAQAGGDGTFDTPAAVAGVTTVAATQVTKDSADLHGSYVGDGQDTHYYFEYGTSAEYGSTAPAPPGADAGSATGQQDVAPIHVAGLKGDTTYHYRLVASNSYGLTIGQDESFTTAPPITNLTTDPPTNVTNESVDLNGSFVADSYDVHYYFEYGITANYGKTAPASPGNEVPPGSGKTSVPAVTVSGLSEGSTYHYRIIASSENGKTVSADSTFKTAEAPAIANLATANVTATAAELSAEISPGQAETTYRFEWGTTTSYGNAAPVPDASVGSGLAPVPVSVHLDELVSGRTYHFRVVALNKYGTTASVDQSFGFYPPSCPNAQARQETGSNTLPDCRGYEMVTPSDLGGTSIFPLNAPSSGYATNPARIAFDGAFGTLPGTGSPPNSVGDLYASTRTDSGWTTKYIGRPSNEALFMGRPPEGTVGTITQGQGPSVSQYGVQASPSMDRFLDYELGQPSSGLGQVGHPSNAPYVWDASGNPLGRWPTNLAQVPGGEDFVGTVKASADFSHFVFSSNVPFAPGGEAFPNKISCCSQPQISVPMCCSAPIYNNNTKTGEVSLISIKEDGTAFRGAPVKVSEDGTRVLMSETADVFAGEDRPLFLSVDEPSAGEPVTYDIAPGHQVHYVDSTDDLKTIYLTSAERLTPDDHDNSVDLFVWKESDPDSLTRVSVGTGGEAGDTDNCLPADGWTGACGVKVATFRSFYGPQEGGSGQEAGNTLSDSPVAGKSGDIYFESPESLVPGKGEAGQVNIYVYRAGSVRFVATTNTAPVCSENLNLGQVCSAGPIARMQVTPNGSNVAFITGGRLTSYDNAGFSEMYTFSPATGRVNCVSCRTDGQPPKSNTFASQNGLFLTEDGRAFFSTDNPLVPRDTNKVNDVYEYTEGKPQLISAGIGSGIEGYAGFTGTQNSPGLIGVSANGTDVYFGTFDVLVSQDHNGLELKIYDARTGGGFPAERARPNCAAADECHGPGNAQPVLPPDRTSAKLGGPTKSHAKHKKRHRKAKKKQGKSKTHKARSKGTNGRNHRG